MAREGKAMDPAAGSAKLDPIFDQSNFRHMIIPITPPSPHFPFHPHLPPPPPLCLAAPLAPGICRLCLRAPPWPQGLGKQVTERAL